MSEDESRTCPIKPRFCVRTRHRNRRHRFYREEAPINERCFETADEALAHIEDKPMDWYDYRYLNLEREVVDVDLGKVYTENQFRRQMNEKHMLALKAKMDAERCPVCGLRHERRKHEEAVSGIDRLMREQRYGRPLREVEAGRRRWWREEDE